MKLITTAIAMSLLFGSSVVLAAGQSGTGAGGADAAPTPQLMQQDMIGQPDISGDGINNAFQVDNPADIGRPGSVTPDAPEPLPVVGGVGAQKAK